jgi:demethylmenaquinone methyltransferase / 2-methoxy-6-polyprenyl-1,4-benzoquinol methylase
MDGHGAINDTARALFAPLGGDYDRWAAILSFGQDPHWRRFLIRRTAVDPGARVLDVATGTGAIARGMVKRYGCSVVGVDQSPQMLDGARSRIAKAGLADRIELRLGSAETLDFPAASFDALTTGYLLRYLDDPLRTMTALLRLLRPGAPFALLDFAVPPNVVARGLWHLYTGVGLPVLGRVVSPGWAEVGRYLRPSIMAFGAAYPPGVLRAMLVEAGGADVSVRLLSLGGGLVAWGVRAVR